MGKVRASSLPKKERNAILYSCVLTIVIVQLYVSSVNISLPEIMRNFQASTVELQWISNVYLLIAASVLLLAGLLSRRFGRKFGLIVGFSIFIAGSVFCGFAWDPLSLILCRGIQGLGGAFMLIVSIEMLHYIFYGPENVVKAVGVWGLATGLGMAIGCVLGGVVTFLWGWRVMFWMPVPIFLLALGVICKIMPEHKAVKVCRFDILGQILTLIILITFTYAVIRFGVRGSYGYFTHTDWVIVLICVLCALTFWLVETSMIQPLVDFSVFKLIPFSSSVLFAVMAFCGYSGFVFIFMLYLQLDLGLNAALCGVLALPVCAANIGVGWFTGRLLAKSLLRMPLELFVGCYVAAGGLLLFFGYGAPIWLLLTVGLLMGCGVGFVNSPLVVSQINGMEDAPQGAEGAVLVTAQVVGQSLGVAVFGALMNVGLDHGVSIHQAAVPAWWLLMVLGLMCGSLALVANSRVLQRIMSVL